MFHDDTGVKTSDDDGTVEAELIGSTSPSPLISSEANPINLAVISVTTEMWAFNVNGKQGQSP